MASAEIRAQTRSDASTVAGALECNRWAAGPIGRLRFVYTALCAEAQCLALQLVAMDLPSEIAARLPVRNWY